MKNRKRKILNYDDDAVIAEAVVARFEFQNRLMGDKYKTVFYCPSYLQPEGRMCIYWGETFFKAGDKLIMKGKFNGDAFIVRSYKALERAPEQTQAKEQHA